MSDVVPASEEDARKLREFARQTAAAVRHVEWEYRVETWGYAEQQQFEQNLNRLGERGWELCYVELAYISGGFTYLLWFKRPLLKQV